MLIDPKFSRSTVASRLITILILAFPACVCFGIGPQEAAETQKGFVDKSFVQIREPIELKPTGEQAMGLSIIPAGVCVDASDMPLGEVELVLYQIDRKARKQQIVSRVKSDRDGAFEFAPVPYAINRLEVFGITASLKGKTCRPVLFPGPSYSINGLKMVMHPGKSLKGRVVDSTGQPIQGVKLWFPHGIPDPIPGLWSTISGAEGHFQIEDIPELYTTGKGHETPFRNGVIVYSPYQLYCTHPDFASMRATVSANPEGELIIMQPGSIIQGRVVDVSQKPVSGVHVRANCKEENQDIATAVTDEQGKYLIRSLAPKAYNLWPVIDGSTAVALEALRPNPGSTLVAPDIQLVRGRVIKGRVIDEESGSAINYSDLVKASLQDSYYIAIKGPASPLSEFSNSAEYFNLDGSYSIRVPPGDNFVQFNIPGWKINKSALPYRFDLDVTRQGKYAFPSYVIRVEEGQDILLDLPVRRTK